MLRNIVNVSWYVRNQKIHGDLKIPTVADKIQQMTGKYEDQLQYHDNTEVLQLLDNHRIA